MIASIIWKMKYVYLRTVFIEFAHVKKAIDMKIKDYPV